MRRNLGIIILSCITVGLLVLFLLLLKTIDSTGPVISYDKEQELLFDAAGDTSILLEGVTAWDERDGNVSDSLMIQDVTYNSDSKGVVTYVARDQSNNVTTLKRKFLYQSLPSEEVIEDEQPPQDPAIEEAYALLKQQQLEQGLPYLRLIAKEVTIDAGSLFQMETYIQEIENAGEEPLQRLNIVGEVNTGQPGTYELEVSVWNLDGNASNIEKLVVIVR